MTPKLLSVSKNRREKANETKGHHGRAGRLIQTRKTCEHEMIGRSSQKRARKRNHLGGEGLGKGDKKIARAVTKGKFQRRSFEAHKQVSRAV